MHQMPAAKKRNQVLEFLHVKGKSMLLDSKQSAFNQKPLDISNNSGQLLEDYPIPEANLAKGLMILVSYMGDE